MNPSPLSSIFQKLALLPVLALAIIFPSCAGGGTVGTGGGQLLSGVIRDDAGNPVSGATVLVDVGDGKEPKQVQTNEAGEFAVETTSVEENESFTVNVITENRQVEFNVPSNSLGDKEEAINVEIALEEEGPGRLTVIPSEIPSEDGSDIDGNPGSQDTDQGVVVEGEPVVVADFEEGTGGSDTGGDDTVSSDPTSPDPGDSEPEIIIDDGSTIIDDGQAGVIEVIDPGTGGADEGSDVSDSGEIPMDPTVEVTDATALH